MNLYELKEQLNNLKGCRELAFEKMCKLEMEYNNSKTLYSTISTEINNVKFELSVYDNLLKKT